MKEKPIIFSTPMVQAILEGRKTMTRRVIKPLKDGKVPNGVDTKCLWELHYDNGKIEVLGIAPVKMGYILWVRETFCKQFDGAGDKIEYRADWTNKDKKIKNELNSYGFECPRWRPSIFMPRAAARIFLEVKSVRVERLQDISEEDASAEGIKPYHYGVGGTSYKNAFLDVWNNINAKRGYSWDSNPWVWVIEFVRIDPKKVKGLAR